MNRILITCRNDRFPRLTVPPTRGTHTPAGRGHLGPSVSAMLSDGPSSLCEYDLTNDRWITPPPGMKPVAGPAAELRDLRLHDTQQCSNAPKPGPVPSPEGAGLPPGNIAMDIITTAFGLAVFGCLAVFCLAMTMV